MSRADELLKPLERRPALSVGALYVALFMLTAATIWNVSRILRAVSWVDHAKEVLTELSAVLDTVTTAESRERAYLLTGDPRYLDTQVRTDLGAHVTRLLILVADNPAQERLVDDLRDAALERVAELRAVEEVRERDGLEKAAALVSPMKTERIRRIVANLERSEKDLLLRRQTVSRNFTIFTITTLVAGGALLLLLIVAFHRDLQRRDEAEAALAEARREAEEANRQKDRFLASLSHELRTPLTPIVAGVEMISRDDLPPRLRERVEMIRRNAELETRLVDDLLDLARITQGKVELQTAQVDLNEVLAHAVETCRPEAEAKRLTIEIERGASSHHVWGDAGRLQQVCCNLLKNAVKFTPEGGRISIRTLNSPGGALRLTVADTGIGISAENLPRVFTPFEQGARAKGFGGLGLGLSIAKAIVERHGGSISARSGGRGQGAVFEVTLPTIVPRDRGVEPAEREPRAAVGSLRILVVEDHVDTARAIRELLRSEGHDVAVAHSIEEAIALDRARPAELLMTDIGLPDGSGLELLEALCASHAVRGIVVSGYGMEIDQNRSRAAGFRVHVVKPITPAKLTDAIRAAMRQ